MKLKKVLNYFVCAVGILISVYAVLPKGISYNNLGIWALFIFGFMLFLNSLLRIIKIPKILKTLNKILSVGVVLTALVLAAGTAIIYSANTPPTEDKDKTLVVLGARVIGIEPSGALKKRLDIAAEYLKENPEIFVIVTGGIGENEQFSEAEISKNYLQKQGISKDRIFTEEKSVNTKENISFAKEVAQKNNLSQNFIICTDSYHQYRASLFCDELDIIFYTLNTPFSLKTEPIYLVREILAVFYYFVV